MSVFFRYLSKQVERFYKIPSYIFVTLTVICFISLFFFNNRYGFRLFEFFLVLTCLSYFKDYVKGLSISYILLSTSEVGKNVTQQIVSLPVQFNQFEYFRSYDIAFVIMDSDIILLTLFFLTFRSSQGRSWADIWMFLFVIWAALSTIFSLQLDYALFGYLAIVRGLIIYIVFRNVFSKVRPLIPYLAGGLLLFQATLGLFQFIKRAPVGFIFESVQYMTTQLVQKEGMFTFYRPVGTFTEPNLYALMLLMFMPFTIISFFKTRIKWQRTFFGTASLAGYAGVLLSSSRTDWLICFLQTILLWRWYQVEVNITFRTILEYFKKRKRMQFYLAATMVCFILFAAFQVIPRILNISVSVGDEWGSFNARLFLIEQSIPLIISSPLFGVGLFNFVPSMLTNSPFPANEVYLSSVHNAFLLIATEIGIPGVLLLLFFFIFLVKKLFYLQSTEARMYAISLSSLGIGIMFLSYFYAGLQYVYWNIFFAMCVGVVEGTKKHHET